MRRRDWYDQEDEAGTPRCRGARRGRRRSLGVPGLRNLEFACCTRDGCPCKRGNARGLRFERPPVPPVRARRRVDAAERERYRREIAAAVAAKARVTPPTPAAPSHVEDEARHSAQAEDFGAAPELEAIFEAIRADLIPLADECLELARERHPDLHGVFDVRFDVIGDEDIGGLVETFELGDDNDVDDPDLVECIRETTLSTLFPPPEGTDRQELRLAIEIVPET